MHGPATPEQVKTVERLQRRRRDPNDRALLEQVAALYKANPDAPLAAISEALGTSPRTAARWAARWQRDRAAPPGVEERPETVMSKNANGEGSIWKRMRDGRHTGYIGAIPTSATTGRPSGTASTAAPAPKCARS